MNYHKNTDSSAEPRPHSRKLKLNSVSVLLTKHGFRVDVTDPLPEPAGAPAPVVRVGRKTRKRKSSKN